MNNTHRFTGKSTFYAVSRPGYPTEAFRWLYEKTHAARVLDVGAGTGIFTSALLEFFPQITAVEPNLDMASEFRKSLPEIILHQTTGEVTGLPDSSVDLITVAQAFHWLDEEKFKREAMRLLAPGGKTAIVWNSRTDEGVAPARDEVCQKYCPNFRKGHTGKRSAAEGDRFLREEYFREVEYFRCLNSFDMTYEQFIGNVLSRSYALSENDENYAEFMQKIDAVYDLYNVNGTVRELYKTEIYLGSF